MHETDPLGTGARHHREQAMLWSLGARRQLIEAHRELQHVDLACDHLSAVSKGVRDS